MVRVFSSLKASSLYWLLGLIEKKLIGRTCGIKVEKQWSLEVRILSFIFLLFFGHLYFCICAFLMYILISLKGYVNIVPFSSGTIYTQYV